MLQHKTEWKEQSVKEDRKKRDIALCVGNPEDPPLLILTGHNAIQEYSDRLKAALTEYYNNNIKPKQLLYKIIHAIKRFFRCEEKLYDFQYTLVAIWDQEQSRWIHGLNVPDWRISLPWKKETREFPKEVKYLRKGEEMALGNEISQLVVAVMDDLMFESNKTHIYIEMINDEPKIKIEITE